MGMRKYSTRKKKQDHLSTFEKNGQELLVIKDWTGTEVIIVGKKNAKNVALYMTGNMTLDYIFVVKIFTYNKKSIQEWYFVTEIVLVIEKFF